MRLVPLLVALWPLSCQADPPLTAEAFEAYVLGKTITYASNGLTYGIEEYLADRTVRWSIAPNLCEYGTWYPDGDKICFVYPAQGTTPYCWTFWLRDGALVALSITGLELHDVAASDQGLPCPGPDVGV